MCFSDGAASPSGGVNFRHAQFLVAQVLLGAIVGDRHATGEVDPDPAHPHPALGGKLQLGSRPADQGMGPSQQLVHVEGLGQVVIGARLEASHDIVGVIESFIPWNSKLARSARSCVRTASDISGKREEEYSTTEEEEEEEEEEKKKAPPLMQLYGY